MSTPNVSRSSGNTHFFLLTQNKLKIINSDFSSSTTDAFAATYMSEEETAGSSSTSSPNLSKPSFFNMHGTKLITTRIINGNGKIRLDNGAFYNGEIVNEKLCGFGELTHVNGCILTGHFENDRFIGTITTKINGLKSYVVTILLDIQNSQEKTIELYTSASEQGDPQAQYKLGICYNVVIGVEKDEKKAASLYRLAADIKKAI